MGSDSRNLSGDYVAAGKKYNIAKPVNRRNKRLLDIITSVFFILGFPVHIFLQKRPGRFYKNVFAVLNGQRTWIGYSTGSHKLPGIRKGVITSTALPAHLNELPEESLVKSDEWYAAGHSVILDLKIIKAGYAYLYY